MWEQRRPTARKHSWLVPLAACTETGNQWLTLRPAIGRYRLLAQTPMAHLLSRSDISPPHDRLEREEHRSCRTRPLVLARSHRGVLGRRNPQQVARRHHLDLERGR